MSSRSNRQEILTWLQENINDLEREYCLEKIGIIGSIARGDYTENSDVDLMVRFLPDTPGIYDKKRKLTAELEEIFSRPVQIASEKYLKPYFRDSILRDAVYVR